MLDYTPQNIIEFWYSDEVRPMWFKSTALFDQQLRSRFELLCYRAAQSDLNDWKLSAEGCLALAIILDQFPLNMYRGKPESFATESNAISVARHAVRLGFDKQIPKEQVAFLYMPFMHSESIQDQNMSVQLFEAVGLADNLKFAMHHRDLIRRFGRFPHRNSILKRQSTAEEIDYLNSGAAFLG